MKQFLMVNGRIIWLVFILVFLTVSCGPSVYYLGEDYNRSRVIQVFYDESSIEQPYTVIGRMAHDKKREYDTDRIKKKMIREAKKVGADGLIFTDFMVTRLEQEKDDRLVIRAKAVKFE